MTMKSEPNVDVEMVAGELKKMEVIDPGPEDVFIEKDDHQIHYKTLSWQASILHSLEARDLTESPRS